MLEIENKMLQFINIFDAKLNLFFLGGFFERERRVVFAGLSNHTHTHLPVLMSDLFNDNDRTEYSVSTEVL